METREGGRFGLSLRETVTALRITTACVFIKMCTAYVCVYIYMCFFPSCVVFISMFLFLYWCAVFSCSVNHLFRVESAFQIMFIAKINIRQTEIMVSIKYSSAINVG